MLAVVSPQVAVVARALSGRGLSVFFLKTLAGYTDDNCYRKRGKTRAQVLLEIMGRKISHRSKCAKLKLMKGII